MRTIIEREHEGTSSYGLISSKRFQELAKDICENFKSEAEQTNYVPFTIFGSHSQNARGKLIHHNEYMRRRQLQQGGSKICKTPTKTTEGIELIFFCYVIFSIIKFLCFIFFTVSLIEATEAIQFLRGTISPWNQVEKNWEESLAERRQIFETKRIDEIFKEFLCLQSPQGYTLVSNT